MVASIFVSFGLILTHLAANVLAGSAPGLDPYASMLVAPNLSEFGVCSSIWCDHPSPASSSRQPSILSYKQASINYIGYDGLSGDDELGAFDDDGYPLEGFWLDAPPDDILYMPPPPMPPGMQSLLASMENDSLRQYIITDESDPEVRCNFCKLFAEEVDPRSYEPDGDLFVAASKDTAHSWGWSSTYVALFSALLLMLTLVFVLVKFKK